MASSTLEETVRTEQETYDEQQVEGHQVEPPEDANGQTALIDRSQYEREDLAIAKVDGNQIDRIWVGFGSGFYLDRSDPNDVAFYNRLQLGRDVTVMVEARCLGTGAKGATNRDGQLDVIIGQKKLGVHTGYIPAAENLDTELARTAEAA